jgi:hypothetical protein
MTEVWIILSELWGATMLGHLLGDVLPLFAGHMTPEEIDGQPAAQTGRLGVAAIMLVPIFANFVFDGLVNWNSRTWTPVGSSGR